MPLLESTGRISDDHWIQVGDEEETPGAGDIIVSHGRLPVSAPGRLGIAITNDVDVASLRGGDVFGEISLLQESPTTASVTSAGSGEVLFLPKEDFHEVVRAYPEVRSTLDRVRRHR